MNRCSSARSAVYIYRQLSAAHNENLQPCELETQNKLVVGAMASSAILAQGFSLKNAPRKNALVTRKPTALRSATAGRAISSRSGRVVVQAKLGTNTAYKKLQGLKILRGTDGEPTDITTTWYELFEEAQLPFIVRDGQGGRRLAPLLRVILLLGVCHAALPGSSSHTGAARGQTPSRLDRHSRSSERIRCRNGT
eukprot:7265097-Pyramimonas_sp.AAC.2